MELDLQRMTLEHYRPVHDAYVAQEEVLESIVPDAYPDVSRIISAEGTALITAKQAGKGTAKVVGTACVNVLYVPEGESTPRSIPLNLPFQCATDSPQIDDMAQIHCTVISITVDARLLNPRKLFVKAEGKFRIVAYSKEQTDVTCGLARETDTSVQKQLENYVHHGISAVLEKPFSFNDVMRQAASKPVMEELLHYRVEPGKTEAKYIGKKLVCKGEMVLSALYRSGTELCMTKFELPYSQILDLENNLDECEPDVTLSLKQVDCVLRDGELDVTVEAVLQAVLWSQTAVTALSDAYSISEQLDVNRSTINLCTATEKFSAKETARKFCETGVPAQQVLSCTVQLNPLNRERLDGRTKYSTDADVEILYLSEDNAVCAVSYKVPTSCEMEEPADGICDCRCMPIGDAMAVPVTGGFEVRFDVEFSWRTVKYKPTMCVTSLRSGIVPASNDPKPSVIVRMVNPGETLWDIAKSCRSTIQEICTANELPTETPEPGQVLLIPASRG